MKLSPGNIWSGSKTLAVFTNPTRLAVLKGNLVHQYPITYGGVCWADVECAYQGLKRRIPNDHSERETLLTDLITCKLVTYPRLYTTIRENGGVAWLEKCSHFTGAKSKEFSIWEGAGRDSAFIRCLIRAYEMVTEATDETQTQEF